MNRLFRPLALALALLAPGFVLAHGKNGVHVMGTVKEVKAASLLIEDKDQQLVDVMTDPNTRFEKSGTEVKATDLKPGEKVVVHGMKMSNGQVHAQLVKFGKQPKKAPAAAGGEHTQH